ncbi:MAG: type IV secretory system conjugative DNA transfer family protein [Paracoccaceae bacterium]
MFKRNNERDRYGSARLADPADYEAAGMFDQQASSIFLGFVDGKPVWYSGPGGMVVTAGARAGKMTTFLAYNILAGSCLQTLVMLDPKGEGAYISQNQTPDGKFCGYWDPAGLHGLPQDRMNPTDYMTIDSKVIVSDCKMFFKDFVAATGSNEGKFFEGRARDWGEGIALTCTELRGVLTLPDLAHAINMIPAGGDDWLDFAYSMSISRFPQARRAEAEIANGRRDAGGGFRGILGVLLEAVSCLSDPVLMESVSPPYTLSMADTVSSDQAWQIYLCPPAEHLSAWSPVIKSIFTAAMIYKARHAAAPKQTWFIDECGQLATGPSAGFDLIPRMFTYGAGIGVQPVAILQTNAQMRELGPEAERLITSSAACRLMFALRDYESAEQASKMLGSQTLEYDDNLQQSRATLARKSGLQRLLGGADPLEVGLEIAQAGREAVHRTKQQRDVMTADEVMNLQGDEALLWADGLARPGLINRAPYWTRPELAGRYHPNPYHPPLDSVRVTTRTGGFMGRTRMETRRVITESVPDRFAHYPQYRNGIWSRVEG